MVFYLGMKQSFMECIRIPQVVLGPPTQPLEFAIHFPPATKNNYPQVSLEIQNGSIKGLTENNKLPFWLIYPEKKRP